MCWNRWDCEAHGNLWAELPTSEIKRKVLEEVWESQKVMIAYAWAHDRSDGTEINNFTAFTTLDLKAERTCTVTKS